MKDTWLGRDGDAAARLVATLSEDQVDWPAYEDPDALELTTADVVALRQVGPRAGHLASISTVLGDAPPE